MLKKEIELKKEIKIDQIFEIDDSYSFTHDLLKKISNMQITGVLKYQESTKTLYVDATILADIQAMDARDGTLIELNNQEYEWNEEYLFTNEKNDQNNLVIGDDFDIVDYAIEQIVLNIPINLSVNYGRISNVGENYTLVSEEEYQQEKENQIDPRWDKLKDFNFTE